MAADQVLSLATNVEDGLMVKSNVKLQMIKIIMENAANGIYKKTLSNVENIVQSILGYSVVFQRCLWAWSVQETQRNGRSRNLRSVLS